MNCSLWCCGVWASDTTVLYWDAFHEDALVRACAKAATLRLSTPFRHDIIRQQDGRGDTDLGVGQYRHAGDVKRARLKHSC